MDFDIDTILEHEAASAEDQSARAQQKTGRSGWRKDGVALFGSAELFELRATYHFHRYAQAFDKA
jgi:hypothetical protein